MKKYFIPKGTSGKLVRQDGSDPIVVKDWITRKDLSFANPVLDPVILNTNRSKYNYTSIGVKLVLQGYSLFGGKAGDNKDSLYVLAIPYDEVRVQ